MTTVIAMALIGIGAMVMVCRISELKANLDRQVAVTQMWQEKYNELKNGEQNGPRHK